jgi:uncharacterized membrane protein
MNRVEFIRELKKELEKANVVDIEEIIADFENHFDFKIDEGKTEEDIAKKIGNPRDIAADFCAQEQKRETTKKSIVATIGLLFLDIVLVPLYISIFASVLVIGVLGIALLVLGFSLIFSINIAGLIPSMPYISSLLFGLSVIASSVVAFIGTFYMFIYVKQWGYVFTRWQKNVLNKFIYPPFSMHPKISKSFTSKLKLINMISVVLFIALATVAYIVSAVNARNFEFWHIWNWFQ